MTTKPTHGGRRTPGPGKRLGRPPLPPQVRRVRFCLRLPGWLVDWLKAQDDPVGNVVERALVEYYRLRPEEGEGEE